MEDFNIDDLINEATRIANSKNEPIEENNLKKQLENELKNYIESLNENDNILLDNIYNIIMMFLFTLKKNESFIDLSPQLINCLSVLIKFHLEKAGYKIIKN